MKKIFKRPEWVERLRVKLIRKLGGFSFLPPDKDHIIVQSTTVAPQEYTSKVIFTQKELYDVTPSHLEQVTKEKLRAKLINSLVLSDKVDYTTIQDEETGTLEMRAIIWIVDPKVMRRAKNENR